MLSAFRLGLQAQQCTFSITGHIQDKDTREVLAGATVSIPELKVRFVTDNNGDFRYDHVCAGVYTVEVSHAGCETVRRVVTVSRTMHLDILVPHLRYNLDEVVVEAATPAASTGVIGQLRSADIGTGGMNSLAEVLSRINGVNMLQTGSTISKPVIHGLHSNRILTIVNGVRQEGQQWGNEHAPEIDVYIADRLTVVKGVDELKYGSDAIGGVVLVDPKPVRPVPGYNAEINTAYSTNNGQYAVSGIFEHKPAKLPSLSYRVQGTYKRAASVMTPDYRLNNTGLQERNFSLTANWKKEHYQLQAFYSEFNSDIGIFTGAHIGNERDLVNAISRDRPDDVFLGRHTYSLKRPRQEVLHRLLKLRSGFDRNGHRINLTVAGQYNHRSEYDIVRSSSVTRPQVSLAIITLSEELSYEHPTWGNLRGTAGLSFMQQDNSYSGRYLIPNYFSSTYGGYWIEKWSRNKWSVEGGLRFDNKNIDTRRMKYGGEVIDHRFNFSTFAASLSSGYRPEEWVKIHAGLTLSERAPHVNELLTDGIHEGAGIYERGDITLQPEKSFNISAGIGFSDRGGNFSGDLSLYWNRIHDFIYQQPVPDAPVSTIVGAFPLREYRQTNASLAGMDVSVMYRPARALEWISKASLLRARDRETRDWLILMPADRWSNELTYRFGDHGKFSNVSVSAEYAQVFRPRVPEDRNGKQDYKEPPGPYGLVNLSGSATIMFMNIPLTVGIGVKNLLNVVYRDYLNSFRYYTDEMGRNITFRLKVPFEKFFIRP